MIRVTQNLRQKRKIKALPCFTRLRGHDMGDQFGQELLRGTLAPLALPVPSPCECPQATAWPSRARPRALATENGSVRPDWLPRPPAATVPPAFVALHRASTPPARSRSTGIAVSRTTGDSVRQSDTT